jgi:hypothetical protein
MCIIACAITLQSAYRCKKARKRLQLSSLERLQIAERREEERFQKEEKLKQVRESETHARMIENQQREVHRMHEEEARQKQQDNEQHEFERVKRVANANLKAEKERQIAKEKQIQFRKDQAAKREQEQSLAERTGESEERHRMVEAEMEQCQFLDSFWGLEKEQRIQAETLANLAIEDVFSRQFQDNAKRAQQHDKWDAEELERRSCNYMKMLQNEQLWQRRYMKTFCTAATSDEVIQHRWHCPFSFEKWCEGDEHAQQSPSFRSQSLSKDRPGKLLIMAGRNKTGKFTNQGGQKQARHKKDPRNLHVSERRGKSRSTDHQRQPKSVSTTFVKDSDSGISYPAYSKLVVVQNPMRRLAPNSTFHALNTDVRHAKTNDIRHVEDGFVVPIFSQNSVDKGICKKYTNQQQRVRERLEASRDISQRQSHNTPVLPMIGKADNILSQSAPHQLALVPIEINQINSNNSIQDTRDVENATPNNPSEEPFETEKRPIKKPAQNMKQVLRKVFRLLDLDGSGNVEKSEIIEALSNDEEVRGVLCEHRPLQELLFKAGRRLEDAFASMDTDGRCQYLLISQLHS